MCNKEQKLLQNQIYKSNMKPRMQTEIGTGESLKLTEITNTKGLSFSTHHTNQQMYWNYPLYRTYNQSIQFCTIRINQTIQIKRSGNVDERATLQGDTVFHLKPSYHVNHRDFKKCVHMAAHKVQLIDFFQQSNWLNL